MYEAEVTFGSFIVSGCEPSGVFEFVEAALDAIAQRIDVTIDRDLGFTVAFHWNNGDTAPLFHIFANKVGIIALVAKQNFWRRTTGLHHGDIAFKVGCLSARQGRGYGQSHAIGSQMYFRRKATF